MSTLVSRVLLWAAAMAGVVTAQEDFGIFEWMHGAPGGFYHPDQEFRFDPETGAPGVFAKKDIPVGTVLTRVPWSHLMISDDPSEEGQLCCGTVRNLAKELKKGNRSDYAPYINYLTAQAEGQIPSGWSVGGKKLVGQIVGGDAMKDTEIFPVLPTTWLTGEWKKRCQGDIHDETAVKAAQLVIQRSDDALLIPAYDMYNHRNGKWLNTETIMTKHESHVTTATRNIEAGQQIYISYNMCAGCEGRKHEYGTAEIFRDYGFVEIMPQRWHFEHLHVHAHFNLDLAEDGSLVMEWDDEMSFPKTEKERAVFVGYLREQLWRLQRLRNIGYKNGNPGIPEYEWETAWKFELANVQAMTMALDALEAMDGQSSNNGAPRFPHEFSEHRPHYDTLGPEADHLSYSDETCDNENALSFPDHKNAESLRTHYQELDFKIEPESKDVVMTLDGITQIASLYRPQYHEYSVHAAARFLDSVKKVVFVGGGDSMLLHEILKYPELELVVGLELDQTVTRKSFRYFHTQPHFDDPRVEWWFGDATKSLLLLPEEYWQSFDLVLVDLSETVMSLSVTGELDVFDALALLLKPEGVLVKNEIYIEALSRVFDYSTQICYQSPIICDQVLTMGSNKVDFFHAPLKDHGISNLLYTPMVKKNNRHDFLHDYRRNNARDQGKCDVETILKTPEETEKQSKSAGILEVVEAENTTVALDESVVGLLEAAATEQGFQVSRASVYEEHLLLVFLKEGYLVARMFPQKKYCSLDINLWGKFHKLKSLSSALTKALGSEAVSRFRVVVGGMYGSPTWSEDRGLVGPQIVQTRNCDEPPEQPATPLKKGPAPEDLIAAAIDETLGKIVKTPKSIAVALCGGAGEECLAESKLQKARRVVEKPIRLSGCPSLDPEEPSTMYDCETSVAAELRSAVGGDDEHRIRILLVDSTAPYELLQVVSSLLNDDEFRESVIDPEETVVAAWSPQPQEEPWRQQFLERFRKQHRDDPVSRALYVLRPGGGAEGAEFGMVAAGDGAVAYTFDAVESSLRNKFQKKGATIDLATVYGGKFAWWDPWEPREFLQSDYDDTAARAQFFGQEPLAQHTLFQLEPLAGRRFRFDPSGLRAALRQALERVGFECPGGLRDEEAADGLLVYCLNPEYGSVILSWDGRKHIDVSYYLADVDEEDEIDTFLAAFLYATAGRLGVALRDDMPRGVGRVVNFEEDTLTPEEYETFQDRFGKREYAEYFRGNRQYGYAPKAEEGSCDAEGADSDSCWPEPPKL